MFLSTESWNGRWRDPSTLQSAMCQTYRGPSDTRLGDSLGSHSCLISRGAALSRQLLSAGIAPPCSDTGGHKHSYTVTLTQKWLHWISECVYIYKWVISFHQSITHLLHAASRPRVVWADHHCSDLISSLTHSFTLRSQSRCRHEVTLCPFY